MTVIASCIHSMARSGGSELNAVRTAEQLVLRGHEVVTLTFDPSREGMYARYQEAGIEVHSFPVNSLVGYGTLKQVIRISAFLNSRGAEVVLANDRYTNFLMVLAARLAGVPSIASKRYTHYRLRRHYYTDMISFRLATAILANSECVARSVVNDNKAPRGKVSVVPNFIDDAVFSYRGMRAYWRERFQIPAESTVFGIVAQLRPEKNHLLLLEAFNCLLNDHPQALLLIVGDGPERAQTQRRIESLGIQKHVALVGHVPDAWHVYSAIDVAILPSSHEGFPNSVIEAMAMGLPVIASDVGGIPDAIVNGTNGLLVKPNDCNALQLAMARLASDSGYRQQLGRCGRSAAQSKYSTGTVMGQLETLVCQVGDTR